MVAGNGTEAAPLRGSDAKDIGLGRAATFTSCLWTSLPGHCGNQLWRIAASSAETILRLEATRGSLKHAASTSGSCHWPRCAWGLSSARGRWVCLVWSPAHPLPPWADWRACGSAEGQGHAMQPKWPLVVKAEKPSNRLIVFYILHCFFRMRRKDDTRLK